ncbi:HlyD family type I secretion periplasmic adaptor subunit [Pseudooceanicola nanhaiensis]|jgi:HlyD family secretion protein/adhesin transport system membrane fusion protein|uniref:Membrane fusion protein (MFP) family protein n=1 Tax=Pseudooceanicola nanhaiensis TaxID=375761 RepID=A0A917WKB7_9RHOB|nr:HlyD family type I secretion periplasmic adaptor subunit [Pseudooceanicola nanhaiensis]GGM10468.1 HlyD family type I secretion periplasmic adaptor subunit [Pseudooceanicola nanhaiensis]
MADRDETSPLERFELNDAPVARLARIASLAVLGCLVLLLGWTMITPVDEVVRARGVVEPESSTQRLQSEFGGAVGAVHVELGEQVEAGQLIVEFDAAELLSQLREARSQAFGMALESERLTALVEGGTPDFEPIRARAVDPDFPSLPEVPSARHLGLPEDDVDEAIAREMAVFEARKDYLDNARNLVQQQIISASAELDAIATERPAVERQRAAAGDRVDKLEQLQERGLTPQADLVEAIQIEADYEFQLAELTGRAAVLRARKTELEQRLSEIDVGEADIASARIADVNRDLFEVAERIARLIRRLAQTEFRTPVAGTVQSLPETVVGRFIEAGGLVAEIVPRDVSLRFEGALSPRDVGFVTVGQPVRVKIDTFDFSRFGALEGRVAEVSPTTVNDDQGASHYQVLIDLPQAFFGEDPQRFALLPGMTGEADITTGSKTVFAYLWKPVFTNLDLALTER